MNLSRLEPTPFLMGFSVGRKGSTELPGFYDQKMKVWVVEVNGQLRPLVETASEISEILTKTEATRERDDASHSLSLEISTKTRTQMERDDTSNFSISDLLELSTKTNTLRERDDR